MTTKLVFTAFDDGGQCSHEQPAVCVDNTSDSVAFLCNGKLYTFLKDEDGHWFCLNENSGDRRVDFDM